MAMNPMQRKANNYLLIGVLVTLLITGSIIAILAMQYVKLNNKIKEDEANMKTVTVVAKDTKSGDEITTLKTVKVPKDAAPSNAFSTTAIEEGTIAKIDLKQGTILTPEMIYTEETETTSDIRSQEYNMIELPTQIQDGETIDVRLRMPNGTDYIVVSKKKVTIPTINGVESANTIKIDVAEDEILLMSNAIVEAYVAKGSKLYATTYKEPGMQDQATPTYLPSNEVINLINLDPNIVTVAKNELISRYNSTAEAVRNDIVNSLNQNADDRQDNIETGVEDEINRAREERQSYLESLGGN